ncbi:ankyrin repeat domain-containing protein [Chryseolinea sp. T2]|uniref:ankyrin repeat domain-containing protein n=1 Tax=Chryseolinea sp. T2 TaxID=3129255 RepID=UPI0030783659
MNELAEFIKTRNNGGLEKELKANPLLASAPTEQGISLLQFAAYYRNQEAIEIILRYKDGVDIFEAATVGDVATVQRLLTKQPDQINSLSSDGFTPLTLASYFGQLDVVKLLLKNHADPNIAASNQMHVAPLHSACAISNYEIAALLIKAGADVNARQHSGVTPLHSAAHNGQAKLAKLLIDNGSDVNVKSDAGQTPLTMAKEKGDEETVQLIIKYGGC